MTIEALLQKPIGQRDESWETGFLKVLPHVPVRVVQPEPQQGPDGMPYLLVELGEGADDSMGNVMSWLSERGIGLVVNPYNSTPDYVLNYGMVWNFRERGELLSETEKAPTGSFVIENGQEVLAGTPSATYLPPYARKMIKQFLMDQGIFAPKVLMASFDEGKTFDLCFSIESLKSPAAEEHASTAEAISWFLPAHYSVSLISEKTLPGFSAL